MQNLSNANSKASNFNNALHTGVGSNLSRPKLALILRLSLRPTTSLVTNEQGSNPTIKVNLKIAFLSDS